MIIMRNPALQNSVANYSGFYMTSEDQAHLSFQVRAVALEVSYLGRQCGYGGLPGELRKSFTNTVGPLLPRRLLLGLGRLPGLENMRKVRRLQTRASVAYRNEMRL